MFEKVRIQKKRLGWQGGRVIREQPGFEAKVVGGIVESKRLNSVAARNTIDPSIWRLELSIRYLFST